jgi:hypothetical protein
MRRSSRTAASLVRSATPSFAWVKDGIAWINDSRSASEQRAPHDEFSTAALPAIADAGAAGCRLSEDAPAPCRCKRRAAPYLPDARNHPGCGPRRSDAAAAEKWLPGYHAPQAPIELLAGLEIEAGGRRLHWSRDPTDVHAFHVDVPEGVREIDVRFQFLSPTESAQGRVVVSPDLLILAWNCVVLYPAGHFSRGIAVEATLILPEDGDPRPRSRSPPATERRRGSKRSGWTSWSTRPSWPGGIIAAWHWTRASG